MSKIEWATTHNPPVDSQIRFYPRLRTARHMIASIVILFILLLKFCLFCDRIMFIGGKCRYFPRNFQIFSRKSVEKNKKWSFDIKKDLTDVLFEKLFLFLWHILNLSPNSINILNDETVFELDKENPWSRLVAWLC